MYEQDPLPLDFPVGEEIDDDADLLDAIFTSPDFLIYNSCPACASGQLLYIRKSGLVKIASKRIETNGIQVL